MSEELRISFYLKMKFYKRFIRSEIPHSFILNSYTIVELLNTTSTVLDFCHRVTTGAEQTQG